MQSNNQYVVSANYQFQHNYLNSDVGGNTKVLHETFEYETYYTKHTVLYTKYMYDNTTNLHKQDFVNYTY